MTLPGVPGIYYGDELALTSGWAPTGADALLRPVLDLEDLDAAAAQPLLAVVREFGTFRRHNSWLTTATLSDVTTVGDMIGYRVDHADQTMMVWLNPTSEPIEIEGAEVDASGWLMA